VIRTILAGSVLAAALLFAGQPAKATPVPALASGTGQSSLLEKATWVCGPDECTWVNHHVDVVIPPFAAAWTAPIRRNCFWRRGFLGRWRQICP